MCVATTRKERCSRIEFRCLQFRCAAGKHFEKKNSRTKTVLHDEHEKKVKFQLIFYSDVFFRSVFLSNRDGGKPILLTRDVSE